MSRDLLEHLRARREAAMRSARGWQRDAGDATPAVQRFMVTFWVRVARQDSRELVRALTLLRTGVYPPHRRLGRQ